MPYQHLVSQLRGSANRKWQSWPVEMIKNLTNVVLGELDLAIKAQLESSSPRSAWEVKRKRIKIGSRANNRTSNILNGYSDEKLVDDWDRWRAFGCNVSYKELKRFRTAKPVQCHAGWWSLVEVANIACTMLHLKHALDWMSRAFGSRAYVLTYHPSQSDGPRNSRHLRHDLVAYVLPDGGSPGFYLKVEAYDQAGEKYNAAKVRKMKKSLIGKPRNTARGQRRFLAVSTELGAELVRKRPDCYECVAKSKKSQLIELKTQ